MRVHLLTSLVLAMLVTGASAAPSLKPGFEAIHRSEHFLLHHQIESARFSAFRIWDARLADWRKTEPPEVPGARAAVVILHLWADWCAPCREEFPVVRQLSDDLEKSYGDRVQLVLLSETSAPDAVRTFLEKQRERMPRGPHYLDTGEALANALRLDLPVSLSYPVTLVLDSQRVVRHAVVGPIAGRRAELALAVGQLLRLANASPPNPAR